MLLVDSKGKVDVVHSLLDNESSNANVVTLYGPGFKGRWENVVIQHGKFGISIQDEARFNLFKVSSSSTRK